MWLTLSYKHALLCIWLKERLHWHFNCPRTVLLNGSSNDFNSSCHRACHVCFECLIVLEFPTERLPHFSQSYFTKWICVPCAPQGAGGAHVWATHPGHGPHSLSVLHCLCWNAVSGHVKSRRTVVFVVAEAAQCLANGRKWMYAYLIHSLC